MRWMRVLLKYSLAVLGAYLLVGHYVLTWGWSAAIWLLAMPALYGLWLGWPTGSPPPSTPAPPRSGSTHSSPEPPIRS